MLINDALNWKSPQKSLTTTSRLLIGPTNSAGQATGWARAVESFVDDASAHSLAFDREALRYPSDYLIPAETYISDKGWRRKCSDYLMSRYTHVLLESNRPLFGQLNERDVLHDLDLLLEKGIEVALIAHGSDVRVPSRHAEIEPWSPFYTMDQAIVGNLELFSQRTVRLFNGYPGPVFVSTPDLLEFIPGAEWCPVVVEVERWRSEHPVMKRSVPVVAHAPSKSYMKGSELIDPLLQQLDAEGLIDYRRVEGVDPEHMTEDYRDADIVVDQLLIGSYGVGACEAMSAGRIVLGHVTQQVRELILAQTGRKLPIVEVTPDDIVTRIRELTSGREAARAVAARGPDFVRAVHDGRRSAAALSGFLRDGDGTPEGWMPPTLGQKVVMMAGNDIVIDSRVMKYAQTVAQWGMDVTALGIAGNYLRGNEMIGPVAIRCPSVPKRLSAPRRRLIQCIVPWFANEADRKRAIFRLAHDRREFNAALGRLKRNRLREPLTITVPGPIALWRIRRGITFKRGVLRARQFLIRSRGLPLAILRRWKARAAASPDLGVGRRRKLELLFFRHSGLARWKQVLPEIMDQEAVLGPILDRLRPDLIHVHDVFMIGVAVQAAQRAALRGRTVKIIYDAHEYIPGLAAIKPRRVAAYSNLERAYIGDVDQVITVSEPLAARLQSDHHLARQPHVVLNAPVETPPGAEVPSVREVLELNSDVPLLVYAGGVNRARGVATAVDALSALDGVHLAIVARGNHVTRELVRQATAMGVADRFHVVPFVDPEFVPLYLRSTTIGLSPLLHAPNHDVAVTNKFCEYIAAGIPIVSSDTTAQADLIASLDLGAVHRAGDTSDFVRAVIEVLNDHERLSKRISEDYELRQRFSWVAQAEVIRDVYESVLGQLPHSAWLPNATRITNIVSARVSESQ